MVEGLGLGPLITPGIYIYESSGYRGSTRGGHRGPLGSFVLSLVFIHQKDFMFISHLGNNGCS